MRKLKFRIWVKDEKRYYDESDEESYMIVPNGNVTYTSEAYEEDDVWFNDTTSATNDVIVEQYTGLKDKNGKEIYEGDIVSVHNKNRKNEYDIGVVEFGKAAFRCPFLLGKYHSGQIEVIGNVHENADLLEE